jgi:Tol biopolymer transport system component
MQRILVVANTEPDAALVQSLAARARAQRTALFVVCPALNSWLRRWCSDEDGARKRAEFSLETWLDALRAEGVAVDGLVGDGDPGQAAADAVRLVGACEVVVLSRPRADKSPGAARPRLARAVGIAAFLLALLAATTVTAAAAPGKTRNGKISFWSDRAFDGRAQVFVMNADGSRQRRLTNLFSAKRGAWSPDGRRLAFDGRARATLFDFDIFVARADGRGVHRITRGSERDTMPSWSPDGRFVAFMRDAEGGASPALWIVGSDGRGAHHVADGGRGVWSPDGTRLAVGGFGLTLIKPDGTEARTVVAGESEPAAWSRDGRRLLFTSYRDGNPEVYLVGSDGSRLRRLTRKPGDDYAADFSPDGRKILFTSDRTGFKQVYVMNPDGSGVRNLSRSRSNDWATSWQPLR